MPNPNLRAVVLSCGSGGQAVRGHSLIIHLLFTMMPYNKNHAADEETKGDSGFREPIFGATRILAHTGGDRHLLSPGLAERSL